jgi:O-antigen chain-terminating methyltransferase
MASPFYKAFEDLHRGSRELIKTRLAVYLPFIEKVRSIYPETEVLDLGCGRGEWLELLQDQGFIASGVDQDDDMLAVCRSQGLKVITGDALAYLQTQASESKGVISGFHLAEHISFDDLQSLITESLRVLKPAGLLILETPNPENLVVGSSSFYLDPTHQRPLPSELLSFLATHLGFARAKILGLQESIPLRSKNAPTSLFAVLSGVSPDYAVIAQKTVDSNDEQKLTLFEALFTKEYGLGLETLANRYQAHLDHIEGQVQFLSKRMDITWKLLAPLRIPACWLRNLFK